MSDCPDCGGQMTWMGGITPGKCVLAAHLLCHSRATKARKAGKREGWVEAIEWLRAQGVDAWDRAAQAMEDL